MILGLGFGMRVIGGQMTSDGRLVAQVVWVAPGGVAHCNGVHQGDIVSCINTRG